MLGLCGGCTLGANCGLSLEPLCADHDVDQFDCGWRVLDEYLRRRALADQHEAKIRTFIAARSMRAVGYLTIAPGVVEAALSRESVEGRRRRRIVPVLVLSRLAVDLAEQRKGLGRAMLSEALRRSAAAANVIGARAIVTHALSKETRSFFELRGFEPFPGDGFRLYLALGDACQGLGWQRTTV
jgi:GNAT superfamily N-acetyltransferase